ncbi:MAG: hypothetical protein LBU32_27200 [Clostridiales bacterium]|nr:hypothetical protein [Clostridiales bacterium]
MEKCKAPSRKAEGIAKEAAAAPLEMPDLKSSAGRRDLALMALLHATAARIGEILPLKMNQVHMPPKIPIWQS